MLRCLKTTVTRGTVGRTTLMRSTNSGAAINQLWGQRLRPRTVSRDAVFSRACVIAGGGRTRRYLTASAPPRKYTLIINERHTHEQATAPTHRLKATTRPHRRLREKHVHNRRIPTYLRQKRRLCADNGGSSSLLGVARAESQCHSGCGAPVPSGPRRDGNTPDETTRDRG